MNKTPVNEAEPEDELLEVIDAEGQVLALRRRGEIHGDPSLRHRAVHVMVKNGAGALLLQRRSSAKRIQPGKWDSSVGGHVDPGESYQQAALRELSEELGVTPPSGSQPLELLHDYVWQNEVETEHIRTYALVCDGPFHPNAVEVDEVRFFTDDELRAAVGGGSLTPNLEYELTLLGIIVPRP